MNKLTLFYQNYFIIFNHQIIIYMENNNIYIHNISSARKFCIKNYFVYFLENNEIMKKLCLFFYNKNKYLNKSFVNNEVIAVYKKEKFFKEVIYENKGKVKIIGRGWKIVKFNYQLLIKLGYSHMIFFNLFPSIKLKMKKKKKKYYLFQGIFYNELNSYLNRLKIMRIPDVYTRKGIFHRRIIL